MTQFALAINSSGDDVKTLKRPQDSFLLNVSRTLFPGVDSVFAIDVEGKDVDYLMLDSQRVISEGKPFRETVIYKEIVDIVNVVDEIVFWYGSEFEDLDYVYDVQSLLWKLESAALNSACELYVHYRKRPKD